MIDMIWHVCAVPLDLPETERGSGQWCLSCRRDMMDPLTDNGLILPDVVTSNTPPSTPLHDVYFFPSDDPCPEHVVTNTQDPHTHAPITAPRLPLDLPELCWDVRPPMEGRDRGGQGEAENTCLVWKQVGEELREVADTSHLEYMTNLGDHQEPTLTTVTTIAAGLCLSLVCLASWELITKYR